MVLACIKPFSNLLKSKFMQVHPVDQAKIFSYPIFLGKNRLMQVHHVPEAF